MALDLMVGPNGPGDWRWASPFADGFHERLCGYGEWHGVVGLLRLGIV